MKLKLRASIVLAVIVGLLIPVSVTSVLYLAAHERDLERGLMAEHERLADILALGMQEPLWTFNPEAARPLLDSLMRDPRVVHVEVLDKRLGVFLARDDPTRRVGGQFHLSRDVRRADSGVIGSVVIELDSGRLDAEIARNRRILLGTVIGQLLLSLLLIVALLQRRLLAPIRRLMLESGKLARRELDQPFSWQRNDELGSLGNSLENTRAALQTVFEELEAKNRALEDLAREQHSILENTVVGIAFLRERRIERCNQALANMFGYTVEELVGTSTRQLHLSDEAWEMIGARVYGAVARGGSYSVDIQHCRRDGTTFWTNSTLTAVDRGDLSKGIIWVLQDIDQRKRAEETLREYELRVRRLVESNIIGVFFWDLGGAISDANDAFLEIVGRTREELRLGRVRWRDMTPPEYHESDDRATEMLRASGSCEPYEKEFIRADGVRVPVLVGGALIEGSREQGVAFVLDLSEQKRAEERIRYLAQHDALTGLPNRALLQDRIGQAIAQARRSHEQQVAVLFIDLDHFKHINDSLGHQTGDRLLQVVAGRLQRCLRDGDSVARLGGDEFVIGLPALADGRDAALIAEKALAALRREVVIDGHELHVTASIGISVYPSDGEDAQALMRAADIAMYHAKERGRNNYQFFAPHLNEQMRQRLDLANRLHNALARDEFLLHYQPQVELASGRVVSVEALLRWVPQDGGGMLSFADFAVVAEETGLVLPLGEWTLREACRELRRWHNNGYTEMCVAVNISPRQLRQAQFHEVVRRVLEENELPGSALELEITESTLMLPNLETLVTLESLVQLGVRLSVDDFGMGYSNLAYLRRFPISALKIDRSFVSGVDQSPNDAAIVTAIVAMAKSLRLRIVAEGVETEQQFAFVQQVGCDAVQGFYFAKPMTAGELLEVLGAGDVSRRAT